MNGMNLGVTVKSFDNVAAPANDSAGTAFALPDRFNVLTWRTKFGVNPASLTIKLQTSNDNVDWYDLDTTTAVAGEMRSIYGAYAKFVRGYHTVRVGGSGITVEILAGSN